MLHAVPPMPNHDEISTITTLNVVVDYAFFCFEVTRRRRVRRRSTPISVLEQQNAIVAISQIMISLEGYINRVLYLLEAEDTSYGSYIAVNSLQDRLRGVIGDSTRSRYVLNNLAEALVMRNSIMHAHLYQTQRNESRTILGVQKRILDANHRGYRNLVDINSYRTRSYKYHVVPSEIGFDDVLKCIKLWNRIYSRIESLHGGGVAYLAPPYPYNFKRFMTANNRELEFEAIPLDHNGSLEGLLRYFKWPDLYTSAARGFGREPNI